MRNIPARRDVNEDDVKRMVESVRPLKVHSVAFDQQQTEKVLGKRTALVRLEPLPLPWLPTEPDVRPYTDSKNATRSFMLCFEKLIKKSLTFAAMLDLVQSFNDYNMCLSNSNHLVWLAKDVRYSELSFAIAKLPNLCT